jgi:hypothetical protein
MSEELREGLAKVIDDTLNRCECCDCSAEYEAAADAALAYTRQHDDWRAQRALFAAMAMQGLLADPGCTTNRAVLAISSIEYADALLAELAKEQPK